MRRGVEEGRGEGLRRGLREGVREASRREELGRGIVGRYRKEIKGT